MHGINTAVEVLVAKGQWQIGEVIGTERRGNDPYYRVRVGSNILTRAWWDVRSA